LKGGTFNEDGKKLGGKAASYPEGKRYWEKKVSMEVLVNSIRIVPADEMATLSEEKRRGSQKRVCSKPYHGKIPGEKGNGVPCTGNGENCYNKKRKSKTTALRGTDAGKTLKNAWRRKN